MAEQYVVLLRDTAPLGGICPVCTRVMDEGGCRIARHYVSDDPAQTRGIGQVLAVFCGGTPTVPVQPCPCDGATP